MLNTSHPAQPTFIDELGLFGLRQVIRITRWLDGHLKDEIALLRRYYWLPWFAGLVGFLIGFLNTAAR